MRKELEKILEDGKFVKELMFKETREEAKKAIEDKGVLVTDEEMEKLYQLYSAIYEKCKTMSKEDLDKIAGGVGEFTVNPNVGPISINGTAPGVCTIDAAPIGGGGSSGLALSTAAIGTGICIIGSVINYFKNRKGAEQAAEEYRKKMQLRAKESQKQRRELNDKRTNLLAGAAITAGIVGTGYVFRDEIKSWIKGHSK